MKDLVINKIEREFEDRVDYAYDFMESLQIEYPILHKKIKSQIEGYFEEDVRN